MIATRMATKILLHGKNIIGSSLAASGAKTYMAFAPAEGKRIGPEFHEATDAEVNRAAELAAEAAQHLFGLDSEGIASFLLAIRKEIEAIGDELNETASQESGLDLERLKGERMRTLNQLSLFADVVREGSWVDARIDPAMPDRKPLPRPDIRRMLRAIGPVAVFGASNFPLAFSVAGGDTASAFAAGNPVIVKAHPAHPRTSELVGTAIAKAVQSQGLPEGTFSMLHGLHPEVSLALARHPKIEAVAFTGSQRAGMALFQAAAQRPNPIPVYAEMGSVNPVFLLPSAVEKNPRALAEAFSKSVLLGVGQFCTCPGLAFGVESGAFTDFYQRLDELIHAAAPAPMLNPAIAKSYADRVNAVKSLNGVHSVTASRPPEAGKTEGQPAVMRTDAKTWLHHRELQEEIFGPATVVVRASGPDELLKAASALEGTLTATIHGTAEELAANAELIRILSQKAGRLLFNGFPTGVEVGHAMHHGGPFPATTDEKFTSVGTAAIFRFARPICFQNFPEQLLPPELKNSNPRNLWRRVDGAFTRDPL